MKSSAYNYFIPYKGKYICFNGITKRFFLVTEKNFSKFEKVIFHPETIEHDERFIPFLKKMEAGGFVVRDDVDESVLVERKFREARFPEQYMLMILPTYRCNLRCWYCIQEHQSLTLTDEMVARVKLHIEKYLSENMVRRFRLSWFGGEPLLAFDQIVDITKFARDFCKKNYICFYSDVTTNSLLLNDERIALLGEMGVRIFQITVDGCRECHNKVKRNETDNAFDMALGNIASILRLIPDSTCRLRGNYSEKSLMPSRMMEDIDTLIPQEYRRRVTVSAYRIWQLPPFGEEYRKLAELRHLVRQGNYRIRCATGALCYVDYEHFNCVFPNGRVGKCENERPETAKGFLAETGDIVWEADYPFEESLFEDDNDCAQCRYLPYCMGPCPQRRNEMLEKHGKVICKYHDADASVETSIKRYCETILEGVS